MKRQISEQDKKLVQEQQRNQNGSLSCFISGEIIDLINDEIEYDHILPYAKQGDTDLANIRIVKKIYNRRKSDQSLYEVRDNLKLEQLFIEKKNKIKLQDIFKLKDINKSPLFLRKKSILLLLMMVSIKKNFIYCLIIF